MNDTTRRIRIPVSAPIVTYAYIALCVIAFLVDAVSVPLGFGVGKTGCLSVMGMRINAMITMGQWWRLITPMFLHGGFTHILMNCFALYVWGRYAEAFYGKGRYILILLLSGIAGCAAGYALSPYNALGASGAVFGIFGAFLAFGKSHRKMYNAVFGMQIVVYVLFNLISGFITEGIDNIGHLGGLAGGYLTGLALGMVWERRFTGVQLAAWLAGTIILGAILGLYCGHVLVIPADGSLTWMMTDYYSVFGIHASFLAVIFAGFFCYCILCLASGHRMRWYQFASAPAYVILIGTLLFIGYLKNFHYLIG